MGGNATDCTDTVLGDKLRRCDDYMEWNARAQLTTWHRLAYTVADERASSASSGGRRAWGEGVHVGAKLQSVVWCSAS